MENVTIAYPNEISKRFHLLNPKLNSLFIKSISVGTRIKKCQENKQESSLIYRLNKLYLRHIALKYIKLYTKIGMKSHEKIKKFFESVSKVIGDEVLELISIYCNNINSDVSACFIIASEIEKYKDYRQKVIAFKNIFNEITIERALSN